VLTVWLLIIVASLGALSLLGLGFRPWRAIGQGDLGVMSQQWLAEHRVGSR
jgi:hypothetical protein